ncbi:hypothetical protein [Microbacterium sp. PF5]|uniref:hypothetical protein n=1 Tax=Microbacterium sp. PF5 TaxID=2305435 RepID=UPI00109B7F8F|nr:hypothetical protein [Microbacterium sp. PF5]
MRAVAHTSFHTSAEADSVLAAVRRIAERRHHAEWRIVDDRRVVFTTRGSAFSGPQTVHVAAAALPDGSDVRIALEEPERGHARRARGAADRLSARLQLALR